MGIVNVETNPGLAARFFVSRLPTVVHIKDQEGNNEDKYTSDTILPTHSAVYSSYFKAYSKRKRYCFICHFGRMA
jgi:hypothetical protein